MNIAFVSSFWLFLLLFENLKWPSIFKLKNEFLFKIKYHITENATIHFTVCFSVSIIRTVKSLLSCYNKQLLTHKINYNYIKENTVNREH